MRGVERLSVGSVVGGVAKGSSQREIKVQDKREGVALFWLFTVVRYMFGPVISSFGCGWWLEIGEGADARGV